MAALYYYQYSGYSAMGEKAVHLPWNKNRIILHLFVEIAIYALMSE